MCLPLPSCSDMPRSKDTPRHASIGSLVSKIYCCWPRVNRRLGGENVSQLRLTLGCGEYDRTRALVNGTVRAEGIDLDWERVDEPHELFVRVLAGEFDVAEMSLSGLTNARARGDEALVGIPVYTSRLFRHSFIFVNTESGIARPQDLVGRRVGVTDYSVSAAVWIRGMLAHDYGVAPGQMRWFLGGLNTPGHVVPLATRRPAGVEMAEIPAGATLGGLLESGELDALVSPGLPEVFKRGSPKVRRLFENYQEVEADYFRRTGVVPIMHMLVVRRATYEAHPWVARSLYDAFCEAKRHCLRAIAETGAPKVTLTWLQAYAENERQIFGDDPWPYGFRANRRTIETLTTYVYEQGLAERLVPAESLFARETLDT
ncbi:MAG: ABC transporter substrate-binding protein [Chloroflexi bacterium]|nr:ABC transporter substrate-binding protein [Chloroflexota bacterium]